MARPTSTLSPELNNNIKCFNLLSFSSSTAAPNRYTSPQQLEGISGTSTDGSPTVNPTLLYDRALKGISYTEVWNKIHHPNGSVSQVIDPNTSANPFNGREEQQLLNEVLQPNRESVKIALDDAKPSTLTRLVSKYFDHSEHTSKLCLSLQQTVHQARSIYSPLHDLLDILPSDTNTDTLTQSQCYRAFDLFLEFDGLQNPFPNCGIFHDIRRCLSQLRQQLDRHLSKSQSRIRIVRKATVGSAVCLMGTTVAVVVSAIMIASHAIAALVAGPFVPVFLVRLTKIAKREEAYWAQLNATKKNAFVLKADLDTIDSLVARLYMEVEDNKGSVQFGLEQGQDRHRIQEAVKKLRRNQPNFVNLLGDLEKHLCLCFTAINQARSNLLGEINLHRTHS